MYISKSFFPSLLLLLPSPSASLHVVSMAGSLQQVGQTVAAGLAANTQWFQAVGTGTW